MEKSLADQYLDGDIEVDEYTAAVIEEARIRSKIDLADRAYRLQEGIGSSALEENT